MFLQMEQGKGFADGAVKIPGSKYIYLLNFWYMCPEDIQYQKVTNLIVAQRQTKILLM